MIPPVPFGAAGISENHVQLKQFIMNEDVVRLAKIVRMLVIKMHGQFLNYDDMKDINALFIELSSSLDAEL